MAYSSAAISREYDKIKLSAEAAKTAFSNFITALKDKALEKIQPTLDFLSEKFDSLSFSISDSLTPLTVYTLAASGLGNVMKLLGQILGGVLNIFVDLGSAIAQGGRAILSFYRALSGKGTFQEFKDSVSGIGTKFVDLKDNAVDNLNEIGTGFKTFTDRTKSDAKAYADSLNGIVDANKKAKDIIEDPPKPPKDPDPDPIKPDKKDLKDTRTEWEKLVESVGKYRAALQVVSSVADATFSSISGYISSVGALQQAQFDAQIARLDEQLQAELEAAGLAEETNVEKYQREYDEAVLSGDAIAEAEAKKNLDRAKIEDKYQKKKTELEYKAALANWEIQKSLAMIQMFQAPLNAYTSALAIPLVGNFIAPILAAAALAAAAKNYQAVSTAKPSPPKFENGGIVPGSSFTGDNVHILTNSKEAVLTETQQAQLLELANGGGSSNNLRPVIINSTSMFDLFFKASQNGQVFIDERAIV